MCKAASIKQAESIHGSFSSRTGLWTLTWRELDRPATPAGIATWAHPYPIGRTGRMELSNGERSDPTSTQKWDSSREWIQTRHMGTKLSKRDLNSRVCASCNRRESYSTHTTPA